MSNETDTDEKPGIERTMKVAHTEGRNGGKTNIIKASELIEVTPANGGKLSLGSRKIMNLMLQTAAGDAWEDRTFIIAKSELRGGHKSNEHLDRHLKELQSTILRFDVLSPRGREAEMTVPLLRSTINEKNGDGLCYFRFTEEVREMLRQSKTYAILNSRAVLAFESKYSLVLYEIGCQKAGLQNPWVQLTIEQLRALMNVPEGTYPLFANLRRRTIEVAMKEVNALAHFTVSFQVIKKGRHIVAVKFGFWNKDSYQDAASAELLRLTRQERRAKVNREGGDAQFELKLSPRIQAVLDELSAMDDESGLDDEIPY